MRQLRVNTALLAFAIAPIIFTICANLVTGGSLSKALEGDNVWAFPFLIASGGALILYNIREAQSRQRQLSNIPRDRMSRVDKVVSRLAITSGSDTIPLDDHFDESADQSTPYGSPVTVDNLVSDLWAEADGEIKPSAYRAAWELGALMPSRNVRGAIRRLSLANDQLTQPRLKWLQRPGEDPAAQHDPVSIVQGRIGYLIRRSGTSYIPAPPLVMDPCIAVALIAVRENKAPYHSRCPAMPHSGDVDTLELLQSLQPTKKFAANNASAAATAGPESDPNLNNPTYFDVGKLIRPELPHTNPSVAKRQAELIRHVMRHFLPDELSATLFDVLPDQTQARLAVALLTASQWMLPRAWEHWAETGQNFEYAPRLEMASNLSFAAAVVLVATTIVLACWQLANWISQGWSWYFGSSHLLVTWPGWLKALLIIVVVVSCTIWLARTYPLGMTVAIVGCIGLGAAILMSPIARLHAWIPSWGTDSTLVVGSLILAALLAWLGFYYTDRRYIEDPVQLGAINDKAFSRLSRRSRFRPDHDAGHPDWCLVPDSK